MASSFNNDSDQEAEASIETEGGEESYFLPPRKRVHPSEKGKWTRRFYQSLLVLFILLVLALTYWGIQLTA
jgi:hypothetical protein